MLRGNSSTILEHALGDVSVISEHALREVSVISEHTLGCVVGEGGG